jgi:hypothetical protein
MYFTEIKVSHPLKVLFLLIQLRQLDYTRVSRIGDTAGLDPERDQKPARVCADSLPGRFGSQSATHSLELNGRINKNHRIALDMKVKNPMLFNIAKNR